jgi:hypothetical protein
VIRVATIKISINIDENYNEINGNLVRDIIKKVMLFINKAYAPKF